METRQGEPPQPSDRRRQTNRLQRRNKDGVDEGKRRFIKRMLPLGWVPEAHRKGGITDLSRDAYISLAKDVGVAAVATGVGIPLAKELLREKTLKEKVLSFTWRDAEDPEKLRVYIKDLAKGYIHLTQSQRVTQEILTNEENLHFFRSHQDYLNAVKTVNPRFSATHQWGYADYDTKQVFINLDELKKQSLAVPGNTEKDAGLELLGALWHEWQHIDIEQRRYGDYVNNPRALLRPSPSAKGEQVRGYHGGRIFSDSYLDLQRFDEVWIETSVFRMITEGVGIDNPTLSQEYYYNGVDKLASLTNHLPYQAVYNMHATSDFEGFANAVGQRIIGIQPSFLRGEQLFAAIHKADPNLIRQALNPTSR